MGILACVLMIAVNLLIFILVVRTPLGKFIYFCILVFVVWVGCATCYVSSGKAPDSWYENSTIQAEPLDGNRT